MEFEITPPQILKNQCPLRFIERDGKRILQSPWVDMNAGAIKNQRDGKRILQSQWVDMNTGPVEWKDVPLEVE